MFAPCLRFDKAITVPQNPLIDDPSDPSLGASWTQLNLSLCPFTSQVLPLYYSPSGSHGTLTANYKVPSGRTAKWLTALTLQ